MGKMGRRRRAQALCRCPSWSLLHILQGSGDSGASRNSFPTSPPKLHCLLFTFISASSLHKCSCKIVFSPSLNVGFLQLKLPLTHPFLLRTRRLPAEWLTNYLPNWTNLRELEKKAVGVQGEGLTHTRQLGLPSAGKKVTFQNLAV